KLGGHGPSQGKWYVTPTGRKRWRMQVDTVEDMHTAMRALLPAMGNTLEVKTAWSESKGKFVKVLN
ncbi:MAG: hypothetical protein QGG25_00480, partial [Phycisphaerae bacterium]|nr:hypothetical protein [Phycisphaerae bacterium]